MLTNRKEHRAWLKQEATALQLDVDVGEELAVGIGGDGNLLRVCSSSDCDSIVIVEGDVLAIGNESESRSRVALNG